jgi:hypothetical protein
LVLVAGFGSHGGAQNIGPKGGEVRELVSSGRELLQGGRFLGEERRG